MNDLTTWVPHGVMTIVVVTLGAALWRMLSHLAAAFLVDIRSIREQLETIRRELGQFATVEQLGRMGDRFDARQASMAEAIGGLRERVAKVEGDER